MSNYKIYKKSDIDSDFKEGDADGTAMVLWPEGHKPSQEEMVAVAAKEFPGVPFEELCIRMPKPVQILCGRFSPGMATMRLKKYAR